MPQPSVLLLPALVAVQTMQTRPPHSRAAPERRFGLTLAGGFMFLCDIEWEVLLGRVHRADDATGRNCATSEDALSLRDETLTPSFHGFRKIPSTPVPANFERPGFFCFLGAQYRTLAPKGMRLPLNLLPNLISHGIWPLPSLMVMLRHIV